MLYTPLFKRVTAIKNAVVAAVIAAAPIAGALSTGVVRLFVRVGGAMCRVAAACTQFD